MRLRSPKKPRSQRELDGWSATFRNQIVEELPVTRELPGKAVPERADEVKSANRMES